MRPIFLQVYLHRVLLRLMTSIARSVRGNIPSQLTEQTKKHQIILAPTLLLTPKGTCNPSTITNNNANGVALNFSSSWDGTTTVTVNGTLRSYSGYCLRNQSSQSITVNGTGSIRKNNKDALVSALQSVNGTLGLSFSVGGFGGASGSRLSTAVLLAEPTFTFCCGVPLQTHSALSGHITVLTTPTLVAAQRTFKQRRLVLFR